MVNSQLGLREALTSAGIRNGKQQSRLSLLRICSKRASRLFSHLAVLGGHADKQEASSAFADGSRYTKELRSLESLPGNSPVESWLAVLVLRSQTGMLSLLDCAGKRVCTSSESCRWALPKGKLAPSWLRPDLLFVQPLRTGMKHTARGPALQRLI